MKTAKNKLKMKSNPNKLRSFKIKQLLKSKSVSGEPFTSTIGATYREILKLRSEME